MNLFLKSSQPSIPSLSFEMFTAGLWPGKWIFHHNNALSLTALLEKQFSARKQIPVLEYPP
jgi:hypothetical protein